MGQRPVPRNPPILGVDDPLLLLPPSRIRTLGLEPRELDFPLINTPLPSSVGMCVSFREVLPSLIQNEHTKGATGLIEPETCVLCKPLTVSDQLVPSRLCFPLLFKDTAISPPQGGSEWSDPSLASRVP